MRQWIWSNDCTDCLESRGRMRIPISTSAKCGQGCNSSLIVGSAEGSHPQLQLHQGKWIGREAERTPPALSACHELCRTQLCAVYLPTVMVGFQWRYLLRAEVKTPLLFPPRNRYISRVQSRHGIEDNDAWVRFVCLGWWPEILNLYGACWEYFSLAIGHRTGSRFRQGDSKTMSYHMDSCMLRLSPQWWISISMRGRKGVRSDCMN